MFTLMHKVDELKVQAFAIAFDEDIIKTGSFFCVCVFNNF